MGGLFGGLASIGNPWGAALGLGADMLLNKGTGQADQYQQQGLQYAGNQANIANQYQNIGQSAMGDYNAYRGQENQAFGNALNYLQSVAAGPTGQQAQLDKNAMAGNITGAYANARANLARMMASRGISGSSADMGGNMSLAGQEATANAQAANNAYQMEQQRAGQATLNIPELIAQRRAQDYQQGMGAYGSADSTYGNLAKYYGDVASQTYDQINQQNAGLDSGISSIIGGFYKNSNSGQSGGSGDQN